MTSDNGRQADRSQRRDLLWWAALVVLGLGLSWLAALAGARLGTSAPPFLGHPTWRTGLAGLLAPALAAGLLAGVARGWADRAPWPVVLLVGYAFTLAWTGALALVDPASFVDRAAAAAWAGPEYPPALAAVLRRAGLADGLALTPLLALLTPLVLLAVRGVCGDLPARRYLPVLALAPYAIWLVPGPDAVAAVLGAAMVAAGVHASDARRTGLRAAGWAGVAGLLLGTAAMFSYAVPWLGVSVGCLYFARRRAALNLFTAAGALVPVGVAQLLGFGWVDGLLTALHRAGPDGRWWSVLGLVALALAAGPPLSASLRKSRNTPGWPFLVGAGAAVAFSLLSGLTRGGVEHAWLPFFPWLTVAAVAPSRQAGPPVPAPLLLVAAGALSAVTIRAALRTG